MKLQTIIGTRIARGFHGNEGFRAKIVEQTAATIVQVVRE